MKNKYEKYTDKELLILIINDPDSDEGKAAKEVLEYRKFIINKRHTFWFLILSIILTCSAIIQVITSICK